MIRSVRIKNFKGINDFYLNDVSMVNLFGGKNNAGKTSLLESIFLFYDRFNPDMLVKQYSWRGSEEIQLTPEGVWNPIFHNFDSSKKIEIEINDTKTFTEKMVMELIDDPTVVQDINKNYQEMSNRTVDYINNTPNSLMKVLDVKYKGSRKEQRVKFSIVSNNALGMKIIHSENRPIDATFLPSKSHIPSNHNAIIFGELDIKGEADEIVEYLRLIDPRIKRLTSITVSNGNSLLYVDIGIGSKIPLAFMGDGITKILTILLTITSNKNGIVFIDEIENGIHYSVMPQIWTLISRAATENNCQIFCTTHSYECLDSAVRGIKDTNEQEQFRYFRLERSPEIDKIISKNFNYEMLETAVERGWEVR